MTGDPSPTRGSLPPAHDPGALVRSPWGRELLVVTVAMAGPVAMAVQGFDVPLWLIAIGVGLATAITWRLGPNRPIERAAVTFAFLVPAAALGAAFAAAWAATGLVLGEWTIRRRAPLPGGASIARSSCVPILILIALAVVRVDITSNRLGPAPFTVVAGSALAAIAAFPTSLRARAAAAAIVALVGTAGAVGGFDYRVTTAVGSALAIAVVVALFASLADRPARGWHPVRQLGPLLAAFPLALWSMIQIGTWATGSMASDQVAYRAWKLAMSSFPEHVSVALGVLTAPAFMLGLAGIGGYLVVVGRAAVARIALAAALGLATAAAIGAAWQVGLPPLS